MTDFINDAVSILKFSFSWLKGGFWKFFLAILVTNFLIDIIRLSHKSLPALGFLILALIYYSLLIKILRLKGYSKLRENSPGNFLKAILVRAIVIGASLISWFEKKFLPVLLLGILLSAVGASFGISMLLFIGLAVLAVYAVIVVRNYARLYPALGLFLQGKRVFDAPQLAWESTPRKAHKLIAFDAALLAVSWLLSLASVIVLAVSPIGVSVGGNSIAGTQSIYSPLYYLVVAVSALLSSIGLMVATFGYVAIYDWIYAGRVRPLPQRLMPVQVKAAAVPTTKERLDKFRRR